ncbi:MAG: hypothetical protein K2R93_02450 [Gemmatimonadaceae bacterium]|nr:hypothetical protein [Gemmatimonadaceae bacterium]
MRCTHTLSRATATVTSRALLWSTLAAVSVAPTAHAQIADVTRSAVSDISRLTFGQLCEDRFIVRNDGARPVDAEVAVAKSGEHTKIPLGPHEQVEFSSRSKGDVELWLDGKLVATAEKEKRSCKDIQGNASVVVAPLDVVQNDKDKTPRYANYPFYDQWFYGMYGPGFGYGYGALGWRAPYYTGFVGVPIVVGGRGGGRRR